MGRGGLAYRTSPNAARATRGRQGGAHRGFLAPFPLGLFIVFSHASPYSSLGRGESSGPPPRTPTHGNNTGGSPGHAAHKTLATLGPGSQRLAPSLRSHPAPPHPHRRKAVAQQRGRKKAVAAAAAVGACSAKPRARPPPQPALPGGQGAAPDALVQDRGPLPRPRPLSASPSPAAVCSSIAHLACFSATCTASAQAVRLPQQHTQPRAQLRLCGRAPACLAGCPGGTPPNTSVRRLRPCLDNPSRSLDWAVGWRGYLSSGVLTGHLWWISPQCCCWVTQHTKARARRRNCERAVSPRGKEQAGAAHRRAALPACSHTSPEAAGAGLGWGRG